MWDLVGPEAALLVVGAVTVGVFGGKPSREGWCGSTVAAGGKW